MLKKSSWETSAMIADDASSSSVVHQAAVAGRDDAVLVRGVVPPTRNDLSAHVVHAEPGAPATDDLRFDALLDEETLVAELGAASG